ncbi:MAG: XkdF-like putative serine protease domain-containing protein [Candidatus Sericytochromatia bacterium]
MSQVSDILSQLDRQVTVALDKSQDLSHLPIEDWPTFIKGFLQRNFTRQHTQKNAQVRWMVAEKIRSSLWHLQWTLSSWIERATVLVPYERLQQNLHFLATLTKLQADADVFLHAQNLAKKYYDDDDYYGNSSRLRQASQWDIERVNCTAKSLNDLVSHLETFGTTTDTSTDPHNFAQVVADALPVVQAFQDYLPTFCSVLNDADILDLTPKRIEEKTVELAITLPVATSAAKSAVWQPLARVQQEKNADAFQGFVIGIVLEPGDPENRDLHQQWISAEEIEKACLHWSIHHQRIGFEHQEWPEQQGVNNPDAICVWNWIEYGSPLIGGYQVKPGTWLQAWQFISEEKKEAVKNYEINGFSPGGMTTVWKDPQSKE